MDILIEPVSGRGFRATANDTLDEWQEEIRKYRRERDAGNRSLQKEKSHAS